MPEKVTRGQIHSPEAYAQAKMLDHSSWQLPRLITPSDIDMVFDNQGWILACEINRTSCYWNALSRGQGLLYHNLVRTGRGRIIACLCFVVAPPSRQIDTSSDVQAFCPLVWINDFIRAELGPYMGNDLWRRFIEEFYHVPDTLVSRLRANGKGDDVLAAIPGRRSC